MAKTPQRIAAAAAAAVVPTTALTNPDAESCDRLLRSPSATLADADEIAAASMGAGFHEALIKRQGIIIPGEFGEAATVDSGVTSPAPINEAQVTAASASGDWLPPTPTDSSPATARSASEDGVPSAHLPVSQDAVGATAGPTLARRRAPFKIASAMNYCSSGGPGPAKEPPALGGSDVRLRKTRSQSPQLQAETSASEETMSPQLHTDDLGYRSTIFMVAATDENSQAMESNWLKHQAMGLSESGPQQEPPPPPKDRRSQESRRRSSSTASTTVSASASASEQVAHYEALMLRAQEQRNVAMAEASTLQQQMEELQRASGSEIVQLKAELDAATRKLCIEYELRTAAETKCALMECELAELSSNIQYEAQNLVAVERREHRAEVDRMARSHTEVLQLMEMERAQVMSLKLSLETANMALDRERAEADRLRSGMVAFERQVSTLIAPVSPADISSSSSSSGAQPPLSVRSFSASVLSSSSGRLARSAPQSLDSVAVSGSSAAAVAPPMVPEPHIVGSLFFGNDATRPDTRLAEFLGFINVLSDKEAQNCAFMQRSMREDVGPTLVADSASLSAGMLSLSAWSKGRRLVHGVQENTLILESFSPRVQLSRVLSLGCYLCGSSISRPLSSSLSSLSMPMSPPPSSASSSLSTSEQRVQSLSGNGEASGRERCKMYRMRFNDNDEDNKPLCHHCHARMVAVCSFFAYLKIVRKGLIKRPIADIWLEVNKARLQMWLARSGASPDSHVVIAMT
ncbi:RAB3A interacting protein [Coemansia sp. BCRC 34962]|nr:RAB3A interacting protein [Coemansia sp. BCRC 34962]